MEAIVIRSSTPDDIDAIARVHREAFRRDDEARLVEALVAGEFARISLVATLADDVVGHIFFSSVRILGSGRELSALALAPLAVLPAHQRRGIGSRLAREGLRECERQRIDVVLVLGDPHFYERCGFSVELARSLQCRYSGAHFMAKELIPGALAGIAARIDYPQAFDKL